MCDNINKMPASEVIGLIGKNLFLYVFLTILFGISSVQNGTIEKKQPEPQTQGLYSSDDRVLILSKDNFDSEILNKQKANVVEFYNSWCGHCRRFAPVWKSFASDVYQWNPIVVVSAIDCAEDKNNDICRDYEILQYPTLKFFHQKFKGGVDKLGEPFNRAESNSDIKKALVLKLQQEQAEGRGIGWPLLNSQSYDNLGQVWTDIPSTVKGIFLILESENSTMATEVILDLNSVFGVGVRKVNELSPLAKSLDVTSFPSLVVVGRDLSVVTLSPVQPTRVSFRKSIITYMQSNKFKGIIKMDDFDDEEPDNPVVTPRINGNASKKEFFESSDIVYQADIETALRYTLEHEIPKIKNIEGDTLEALKKYLNVVAKYFPFTANGKLFITELIDKILNGNGQWTGERFTNTVNGLKFEYSPVYSTLPEYIGCKGSSPQYRGFTCGLWTMFHTLTVGADSRQTSDASEVLKAIFDYVKYFFGCTECSEHFQKLAAERFKTVAETDGAIIWLWTAHNEVNHRLAGDITEDPFHPKKQFPTIENCPKCHNALGSWDFKQVLLYLKHVYGVEQINPTDAVPRAEAVRLPSVNSTLFILIYMYFACMLVYLFRTCLSKKMYRKKIYIHDTLGKV